MYVFIRGANNPSKSRVSRRLKFKIEADKQRGWWKSQRDCTAREASEKGDNPYGNICIYGPLARFQEAPTKQTRDCTEAADQWLYISQTAENTNVQEIADIGFQIKVASNIHPVNFLEINCDLNTGMSRPYRKPTDAPWSINTSSDHPQHILRQLPLAINQLSKLCYAGTMQTCVRRSPELGYWSKLRIFSSKNSVNHCKSCLLVRFGKIEPKNHFLT